MFRAYFFKLFHQPFFYLGIVGVIGICSLRLLPSAVKGSDVLMEMELLTALDGFRKMFVIVGALPFAANFSDEWNSMIITNCITRKSVRKYAVSNVVMCYISSLATIFIGMTLFASVYSIFIPLCVPESGSSFPPYDVLPPLLFLMTKTFVFAASCAMWAVMGLMLTAFFPSKYIAICAPFVFSYAIERITNNFSADFDLYSLSLSHTEMSALPAFIYSNAFFAVIAGICGIVFTITVERKVQNGFS